MVTPEMHRGIINSLSKYADELNQISDLKTDRYRYDMMSEGLIWDDELSDSLKIRVDLVWALRPILRYRASLIVGPPAEQWREYWDFGLAHFAGWVGFRNERLNPPTAVVDDLRRRLGAARSAAERLTRRLEQRKGHQEK